MVFVSMRKGTFCRQCRDTAAWLDLATALVLAAFKYVLGVLTGSMALQAHALHSLGDFLTKSVNLASIRLSSRPPTRLFPYGFGKVQFLSATFIGLCLMIGSSVFFWHNLVHLGYGEVIPPLPAAMIGAMVSAATAELMHRYLTCVGIRNNSPALRAAAADNRGDALSSLAVLAGVGLSLVGWPAADHLSALLVSLLVFRVGIRVAKANIYGLMDGSVPIEALSTVYEIASRQTGILAVDDIRGRPLGETWSFELRLRVPGTQTAEQSHDLAETLRRRITEHLHHAADIHIIFVPH